MLLTLLAFGGLLLHSRAMRSLVADREALTAHAAADAISAEVYHRSQAVLGLSRLAESGLTASDVLERSDHLLPDFPGGLAVLTPEGELLASVGPGDWESPSVADLLVRSRDSGEPVVSETREWPGLAGRASVVAFAGERRAVAGAFLPGDVAAAIFVDLFPPSSQADVWMIDPQGHVLYRRLGLLPDPQTPDRVGLDPAIAGESGVSFVEQAGEEYVVAFTAISATGWALLLEEPWEAVDNPLLRQTQAAPLVLVPALLAALLGLGFAIRSVVQPLRALERRAASVGAEDRRSLEDPVGGIAEIRSLQATLVSMERRLRAYQESLRRYAGAVVRSMEDERRRVARELHDDTIQALIALSQQHQLAQKAARDDPGQAAGILARLRQQTEDTLLGVRRVIRDLRPIYLEDLGLPAALEMLVDDARAATGVPVGYQSNGTPRRLLPEQEIAVYRIAQEALTNIARHARARSARLELTFEADRFTLSVRDDGIGLPAGLASAEADPADHFGMIGMRERAELIGARLEVTSPQAGGTLVRLELPC